jgi:hypothetical protein
VRGIEGLIFSFRAFEKVKLHEARDFAEVAVA